MRGVAHFKGIIFGGSVRRVRSDNLPDCGGAGSSSVCDACLRGREGRGENDRLLDEFRDGQIVD